MNIRSLWVIMASISVLLFLFQVSIDNINPNGINIYDYNGSLIQSYDSGNYTVRVDPSQGIPELPGELSTNSDAGFTDIFQAIKSWFQDSNTGKVVGGLFYAVPNLIKGFNLPMEFSFALGLLWNLFATMSFVMFMRGVS